MLGIPGDGGNDITVAQLLTHTSGIVRDNHFPLFEPIIRQVPLRDLIRSIRNKPLKFDPGKD
jgi:CubicO group peptidase (beta-lactamase class C family)